MKWRTGYDLIKQTVDEWLEDKAPRLGAALAFYSALSIGPLLLLALAAAGLIWGREAAQGQIVDQLQGMIGKDGGGAIKDMLTSAAEKPESGIVATIFGIVMLLLGASGVFGALQDALNTIWEVKPKPGRGIVGMIRDRFLSLTMVLGTAFLLLTSLVLSAGLTALGSFAGGIMPGSAVLLEVLNFVVSFGVVTVLFAFIFRLLPDATVAWRDVWLGAAITALLFTIGKVAIGLYLGHSALASSYGAAGSIVVLLVWVYYSAQILFFGAEFTQVYANKYGSLVVPSKNAEPATEEMRAQEGLVRRKGD